MHTIKNLTNSPYKINGTIVPARGSADIEMSADDVRRYSALGYFQITQSPVAPQPKAGVEALRAEYLELTGKNADKRWSESRLQEEIDKALEG